MMIVQPYTGGYTGNFSIPGVAEAILIELFASIIWYWFDINGWKCPRILKRIVEIVLKYDD